MLTAGPADVLAVGGGQGWMAKAIRIGGIIKGNPGVANHVIIVTHRDAKQRWMGIEGRPGGVGLVDCTPWLADRLTRSNHAQPRPGGQPAMDAFLASCAKSLGVKYDWVGIAQDALGIAGAVNLAERIDPLWRWPSKDGQLPGAVVCSSLAAMLYDQVDWAHPPGAERNTHPGDWWKWNDAQAWPPTGAEPPSVDQGES
jgi:hypothetical protein